MVPLETLVLFFTTSVLLALSPGPDNLFVLAQSAQYGRRAGITVTLGLCTGILVHTAAVTLGVAALFQTSLLAFTVLKYLGAAYLLYLAYLAFASGGGGGGNSSVPRLSNWKLYRRGVIMNITNPKVSIFFLAFLPQFADPVHGPIAPQLILLGMVFILSTIWVFGGISLVAGTFGQLLARSRRARRILDWLAGSIFAALALKLVLARR